MTKPKTLALVFVFLWFAGGGIAHFLATAFFVHITPSWVPNPRAVIYLSGVVELLLAAALLSRRLRPRVGIALILLICAVSPANIEMWQYPERFPEFPPIAYSLRLLVQALLIACVWWSTRPDTFNDAEQGEAAR